MNYNYDKNKIIVQKGKRNKMKGYVVYNGYMGYVEGSYMLFASEADYVDYMLEE